jgi:hypothetical protein
MDELALTATGLANGLAVEELSDPWAVPDELLGGVLTLLLAHPGLHSDADGGHRLMDMGGSMSVMRVIMLAMLAGGVWGTLAALGSRARRRSQPERPAKQDQHRND